MTAKIIPFTKPKTTLVEPKCSFCKTEKSKCKSMIWNQQPGDTARFICDECIKHAKARCQDE